MPKSPTTMPGASAGCPSGRLQPLVVTVVVVGGLLLLLLLLLLLTLPPSMVGIEAVGLEDSSSSRPVVVAVGALFPPWPSPCCPPSAGLASIRPPSSTSHVSSMFGFYCFSLLTSSLLLLLLVSYHFLLLLISELDLLFDLKSRVFLFYSGLSDMVSKRCFLFNYTTANSGC